MWLCLAFKYLFSSQIASLEGSTKNAYLELAYMFSLFSFPNSKALVKPINSASYAEVMGGKALTAIILCEEKMAYQSTSS